MATINPVHRVALLAWEIGRMSSGLGARIGGLGVIVEELPEGLVKAAARQGMALEVEILSPCFAHYDRQRLNKIDLQLPVTIAGRTFPFEAYEHVFPDGQKVIYFWDEWQLSWTNARALYPDDPHIALELYAAVSQAMAGYIRQRQFDTVHLHDYHVGLVPFYLGDEVLSRLPVHLTIHNATYQGIVPLRGGGYSTLDRIHLPGAQLFHQYFDFFDQLNIMKACMLKVHQSGGKISTVSGDLQGTWGYAAELKENPAALLAKATAQKGSPPGAIFVPNGSLDLFEKLPIVGITNGMSARNRPEVLPELRAAVLRQRQAAWTTPYPMFRNALTRDAMLSQDHTFDAGHLQVKTALRRLLHLEAFDTEPSAGLVLLTVVGRLVEQKNLGLVGDIVERTLDDDDQIKFVILASAPDGDAIGKAAEATLTSFATRYPERLYMNTTFNEPLAKLTLAGGDFTLIPSRFEPCGLVDYEASLLGTIVIGRLTGGLAKVRHCAYLYEWLDISDRPGEAHAFFQQVRMAVDTYRHDPSRHAHLMQTAMAIDASWDTSAGQYIQLYRYGQLAKRWQAARQHLLRTFVRALGPERQLFGDFFHPGLQEYGDTLDEQLSAYVPQTLPGQS